MTARRVLVVEDDERMQRLISRALGAHLVTCTDGSSGSVDLAVALDPELVICDFDLGAVSGRDVIAELRARGITAPVLLVSGAISHDDWVAWAAYLADDFLPKPFPTDLLVHKAHRLLERESLIRSATRTHAELTASHSREAREAEAAQKILARMVQRGSFPRGVRVANVPAGTFGGDVVLGTTVGTTYRWLVGDVTGHTLASALVTIPLAMVFYATCARGAPIEEVISISNDHLAVALPIGMFCAAAMMELDRPNGLLRVWSGGAPDVAILKSTGTLVRIAATDPALAVVRSERIEPCVLEIPVHAGDRILVFTDGLYDIPDARGPMQDLEGVCQTMVEGEADTAFERLLDGWQRQRTPGRDIDDMCLVEVLV